MKWRLPGAVETALNRLNAAGYAAYIVGGCVRDKTLGYPPHDWDICTAAPPRAIQAVFHDERTLETGLKHGTVTVLLSGEPLEITAFRADGAYLDGRHPESVRFTTSLEEDLSRRDFTMNAMAYHPEKGLIDPFGGRQDCESGVIRCVGEPEQRFQEDALRILRALRFSARLGFKIEERTAAALRALRGRLALISRERIAAELEGLLLGGYAERILTDYAEVLSAAIGEESVPWRDAASRIGRAPKDLTLRWAAVLSPLGGEEAARILRSLKAPRRLEKDTAALIAGSEEALGGAPMQYWMMRMGPEILRGVIWLQAVRGKLSDEEREEALMRLNALLAQDACYTLAQLDIRGEELAAALGVQGPEIGAMLRALLVRVTLGETENQKDALLEQAARMLRDKTEPARP